MSIAVLGFNLAVITHVLQSSNIHLQCADFYQLFPLDCFQPFYSIKNIYSALTFAKILIYSWLYTTALSLKISTATEQ